MPTWTTQSGVGGRRASPVRRSARRRSSASRQPFTSARCRSATLSAKRSSSSLSAPASFSCIRSILSPATQGPSTGDHRAPPLTPLHPATQSGGRALPGADGRRLRPGRARPPQYEGGLRKWGPGPVPTRRPGAPMASAGIGSYSWSIPRRFSSARTSRASTRSRGAREPAPLPEPAELHPDLGAGLTQCFAPHEAGAVSLSRGVEPLQLGLASGLDHLGQRREVVRLQGDNERHQRRLSCPARSRRSPVSPGTPTGRRSRTACTPRPSSARWTRRSSLAPIRSARSSTTATRTRRCTR